jgi:branched-chain amino acid transport system substrate-binding protein
MFHVEAANSMYVRAVGSYLLKQDLVKGKTWFSLTAGCASDGDLLNVAKTFVNKNGGVFVGDQMVSPQVSDFSRILLKVRQARPDLVMPNLVGNQLTNFLTQYSEHGLPFPLVGFTFDTAAGWGVAKSRFSGVWPLVWHHLVDMPTSNKYVDAFTKKYGKPPENQSWANYFALRVVGQSMAEIRSTNPMNVAEHLRSGAKFDIGKTREGYFRAYDNQMMMEMYSVRAKKAADIKSRWDIYEALGSVPPPNENLESIPPPKDTCNMAS